MPFNFSKLGAALISGLIISGCASTKIVGPNFLVKPEFASKIPVSLAIDSSQLANLKLTANPGVVQLTAVYGDAFAKQVQYSLSDRFEKVAIISDAKELGNFNFLLNISQSIKWVCGSTTCTFYSQTPFRVTNLNTGEVVTERRVDDTFFWGVPDTVYPLAILGGLSLCVLCPITIPVSVSLEADELVRVVTESNVNSAAKVASSIISLKEIR